MSQLSKGFSSPLSDGLLVVDVNPAFVISIASADVPVTKGTDRKLTDRHWSSKSARSRVVRQRFSELPYYVPEPHSVSRRHSTESWSATDSPSFGEVVKTAERLISASCECSTSSIPNVEPAKVSAAVSVGTLATCDGNQGESRLPLPSVGSVLVRSRSLGDLTQPWSHSVPDQAPPAYDLALQDDFLIDRVERRLRNFHIA